MDWTLNDILKGKATVIKNKTYFPTEAYVTPFLERTHNIVDHYNVHVKLPDQYTKTSEGNIDIDDITFNRVWIEGILKPEFNFDEHEGVIGMVYGIDVRKPVAKFYKGAIRSACTNLCVFNPELLRCQELESETALNYRGLKEIIEYTDDTAAIVKRLKNTPFDTSNLSESLGSWIRSAIDMDFNNNFGKIKLSPTDIISAYKDMFINTKSEYYVPIDTTTTMFNVYNSFTQQITNDKRDILSKPEKTLLVKSILGI